MPAGQLRRLLSPSSRLRWATDLTWVAAFAVVLGLLLLRGAGAARVEDRALLDLSPGTQHQGLYLQGQQRGQVTRRVFREEGGWQVSSSVHVGGRQAVMSLLYLHKDLSLARLRVQADLAELLQLGGSAVAAALFSGLARRGQVDVQGDCSLESGICKLHGEVAGRAIQDLPVMAGRGPVVVNAIYPLLAQGNLGREVEIGIFDPLSFRRKVVTFRIEGRERLRLRRGAAREAIRVARDLDGVQTRVWIDAAGNVLKEELPLGIVLEHESFRPGPRPVEAGP